MTDEPHDYDDRNLHDLAQILEAIEAADTDYDQRYQLVIHAMSCAVGAGLATGIGLDPNEPEWPVVYIELPTGQVSWHMPAHPVPFDGHSTSEKYQRCRAFTAGVTG